MSRIRLGRLLFLLLFLTVGALAYLWDATVGRVIRFVVGRGSPEVIS